MPSKARCSKCSLSYDIKDDRISCSCCPMAAAPLHSRCLDRLGSAENSLPAPSLLSSASDLLRLRQRVDCLLRRIQPAPTTKQNSPTQENQHATAATGAVECRAASHSTHLSTTHASATERLGQSSGPTHSQAGARTSTLPLLPLPPKQQS